MSRFARTTTGRPYHEVKNVHCFECERSVRDLWRLAPPQYLRTCHADDCRVLLCDACREQHELLHQLAGDPLVDRLRPNQNNLRKVKETDNGLF